MADKRKFDDLFWGILFFIPALLIFPVLFVLVLNIKAVMVLWRMVSNYVSRLYKRMILFKVTDVAG